MTREDIITQVNAIIAEEFEVAESLLAPEANVRETLKLDSLNLVDLIALVQYTFKVTIPAGDLVKIQTFENLYDYIFDHLPT